MESKKISRTEVFCITEASRNPLSNEGKFCCQNSACDRRRRNVIFQVSTRFRLSEIDRDSSRTGVESIGKYRKTVDRFKLELKKTIDFRVCVYSVSLESEVHLALAT